MAATLNTFWSSRSRLSRLRPVQRDQRGAGGAKIGSPAGDAGERTGATSAARPGEEGLRVLVANDPLSYREAMAVAIRMLRPHTEVLVGDPAALDLEVERLCPDVVVCSLVTPLVKRRVAAWVDLYPDGDRQATIGMGDRRTQTAGLELDDLLSVIDRSVADGEARRR